LGTLKPQDEDNPETLTTLGTLKLQEEDNPETLTTLGTLKPQDEDKHNKKTHNTTQKTKKIINTDLLKTRSYQGGREW
jgi:hypothetical protein